MPAPKAAAKPSGEAVIRKKYKKLEGLEHVLLRPDTYVGTVDRTEVDMFVHDGGRIAKRAVTVSPGLIKLFDEVLVNARDHVTRCLEEKADNQVTRIDVTIDAEAGRFTVKNNGEGIDVVIHPDHKIWVPEMIFGHLLTSTTYEEEGEASAPRTIGGKNGYGAKLAFAFSTESSIETVDAKRNKLYRQTFGPNLKTIDKPSITRATKKPYTQVTVRPDLARLGGGGPGFDADTMAVLRRRVYDLAAVTDKAVQVTLNGERLGVRSLEHYASLVLGADRTAVLRVHERANERWEYVVAVSQTHEAEQVSFVNGVYTRLGGSHVKHVLDQICKKVADRANKKIKGGGSIKPHQVRSHIFLILNCVIENPTFDSQTKEALTLPVSKFGSKAVVTDKFIDKVCKTGVMAHVTAVHGALEKAAGAKTDGRKTRRITDVPKLDDAIEAGGPRSHLCTLALVEGDSAKTGLISGMTEETRKFLGVFPLRGKLINARQSSAKQTNDNAELTHLKRIMGLETGRVYKPEDVRHLRYGKVLIVTDQDKDGSHIKGLIANAFDFLWPSLLAIPGFLSYMNTPILKARKGKGKSEQVVSFYSEADYRHWLGTPAAKGAWTIKYYKGLGTSMGPEFKEYLAHPKVVQLVRASADPLHTDPALDLAFSKGRANDRKAWLGKAVSANRIYEGDLPTKDFVDGELRDFSLYDCERSIPNAIDGLKTSQRKVLFACFKRRLTSEIKVAQLAGYVAEHSAYHHGEGSLHSTIVNMAQDYTGSNNLNLLSPAGQFGSRHQNGKDAASPRYIFTHLSPLARLVFPEHDDAVLDFLQEDGQAIEPAFYVPIVPMLLLNGCKAGIGTGYSSTVPSYSFEAVVAAVRRRLAGDTSAVDWVPAYRGFRGEIVVAADGRQAHTRGTVSHIRGHTYRVTEVPVTMSYQALLNKLIALAEGKRGEETVRDYQSHSTVARVDYRIEFRPGAVASAADVARVLGLEDTLSLTNMHAFDDKGLIVKYAGPEAILNAFMPVRMRLYVKRREHLIARLTEQAEWLHEQALFVRAVCDGKLVIARREEAEVEKGIVGLGVRREKIGELLGIPLRSLTASKVAALEAKVEATERELAALKKASAEDLWRADLDQLEAAVKAGEGQPCHD